MGNTTDKINGGVGYGYAGEKGEEGEKGCNILFSEIYYEKPQENPIRFLSNESLYVSIHSDMINEIKDGDLIIIAGNNGTKVHRIMLNESDSTLYVYDSPEYEIDMEELPKYQYNAEMYTDEGKISVYNLLSIKNAESNAKIVMYIGDYPVVLKNYGKELKEKIKTSMTKPSTYEVKITIYMYYKIAPYKIIKSLLYETTY